jgi:hypothetical protein
MAYQNGPKIIANGLVLCLDAGNPKSYPGSGTAWTDLSRNGNNGTLTNGPTFSSDVKGNIVFDGTNDYAILANPSIMSGNQVSFCVWSKNLNSDSAGSIIWLENASGYRIFQVHLPFFGLVIFDAGNGTSFDSYDRAMVEDQITMNWQYWGFTKNVTLGTMKIYLNGALIHTETGTTLPIATPTVGYIGVNTSGGYQNCSVALMKFYNRELSPAEILQNYNATKGRFKL